MRYPSSISLRPAVAEDLPEVAAIEARSFSNPWHPDTFRSLLAREGARITVAEDQTEGVLGYSVLWWVLEQGELANLAVHPDRQRRGIGSLLLDHTLELASERGVESLFLEVRFSNEPALFLYLGRGFYQVAVRKDYYRDPREDARILRKDLKVPKESQKGSEMGNKCSQLPKIR